MRRALIALCLTALAGCAVEEPVIFAEPEPIIEEPAYDIAACQPGDDGIGGTGCPAQARVQ